MTKPKISVIVPNYNHAKFLPARLESIAAQTLPADDWILLDDASTDDSLTILRDYAHRPNVELIANERNSGSPFAQWNRGVERAAGEFVWLAESDDWAEPTLLETLVTALRANPAASIAYCRSTKIDVTGNAQGPIRNDRFPDAQDRWEHDFVQVGRDEIANFLYFQNTIPSASAVVFRRTAYVAAGPADSGLRISGDWLQWMRMLLDHDVCYVAAPLSYSRVHGQTQRMATATTGRLERESLRVQALVREQLPLGRDVVAIAAEQQAQSWLQHLRAGRFTGRLSDHGRFLNGLRQADASVAARFAAMLPYALAVQTAKRQFNVGRR